MARRATPAAAGTVKVRNFKAVPDILRDYGLDPGDMLGQLDLPASLFSDPEYVVSYVTLGNLLDACVRATGCEDFGLRVGMRETASAIGIGGYAAVNAPTVGEALELATRTLKLSDTGGLARLEIAGDAAVLSWSVVSPVVAAADHISDAAIAIGCNIMRSMRGPDWRPSAVSLPRHAPGDPTQFEKFFLVPVRFEAVRAELSFPASELTLRVMRPDPDLHTALLPVVKQALAQVEESFEGQVVNLMRSQALGGKLTPERVAAAFGLTGRTFMRRLAANNVSFSDLSRGVKYETAQKLLLAGQDVRVVAASLGYSDVTAFIRAFKSWAGVSPARWRSRQTLSDGRNLGVAEKAPQTRPR